LLVRGGVSDLLLVDNDSLAAQNLVRHTLSGREIGMNKAAALAHRLGTTAPFSFVHAYDRRLPMMRAEAEELLDDRDVVIDCTAAADVPMVLSLGWWSLSRLFVSVSVGYEARRTFLFAHQGHSFPQEEFATRIEPLLKEERALWTSRGETLEGAGCWSPLFPARLDDIVLAAAAGVKIIEELVEAPSVDRRLIVFEQPSGSGFGGLVRTDVSPIAAEAAE
jgi:hypothetical protein